VALRDREEGTTEEKARRGAARTLVNWFLGLASVGVIGAWVATSGWYSLEPGEAAVILRVGSYERTISSEGIHLKLPTPLESVDVVNVGDIRRLEFGGTRTAAGAKKEGEAPARFAENAIQTADSNIVNLSYVLQYKVDDAFSFVFGMAEPRKILHDATQASVREVVGKMTVDEVLSTKRSQVQSSARSTLKKLLSTYFDKEDERSAFAIDAVQLQDVQAPGPVQEAFDDVVAAQQDAERAISEAQGSAQEITQRASAQATELRQAALAYKDAVVVEARGEVSHFTALLAQYRAAPRVTRERLYLETMEAILPTTDKIIVEGESAQMAPILPIPIPSPQPATRASPPATPSSAGEGAEGSAQ